MTEADEKLKQFMLDNFCFDGMKEIGFWPKGTRRTDYKAQAARVCEYFGFGSVYQYRQPEITETDSNVIVAECAGEINVEGQYIKGATAILNTVPSDFECPICTCPQTVNMNKTNGTPHKCTGCKRKLHVIVPLFDSTGSLKVSEW